MNDRRVVQHLQTQSHLLDNGGNILLLGSPRREIGHTFRPFMYLMSLLSDSLYMILKKEPLSIYGVTIHKVRPTLKQQ